MAKIQPAREVPIDQLVIGATQARVRGISQEIGDLAESIRVHGLLEPIVVCPDIAGGYQVLMGQRRVLAHKLLGKYTISAAVIDEPIDQTTAKVLSLTENLIRKDLDDKDVIDACTTLYKKYGTAKAVAEETGLPYAKVLRHVKYDRLAPEMRSLVDCGDVPLELALRVQDSVNSDDHSVSEPEVAEFASELARMTGAQQRQILAKRKKNPEKSVRELLTSTPNSTRSRQIIVTLSASDVHELQSCARVQGITQDQAAAAFIVQGLAAFQPMLEREGHHRRPRRTTSPGTQPKSRVSVSQSRSKLNNPRLSPSNQTK
jgi:ParB family transcriptional regulator, chromosome partitioning protein